MARGKLHRKSGKAAPGRNKRRGGAFNTSGDKKRFKSNGQTRHHKPEEKVEPNPTNITPYAESSSDTEDENEAAYQQLISTFGSSGNAVQSDSDESTDDEGELDASADVAADVMPEEVDEVEEEEEDGDGVDDVDPFMAHFQYEISAGLLKAVADGGKPSVRQESWPRLGQLFVQIPHADVAVTPGGKVLDSVRYAGEGRVPKIIDFGASSYSDLGVKSQIVAGLKPLSDFQTELFSVVNNYQDLYYAERSFGNGEDVRYVYCLHAVNHVLKTRTKVLHHNARLAGGKRLDTPEEFRDQGLVRPKVLVVVPFRDAALRVIRTLIDILVPNDTGGQVINKKRCFDEFSGGELHLPKKNPKPDDYRELFTGNTDDTFRIGISLTKKTVKLYTEFYAADIIVASPLGLRMIIGAAGEADRDYDFLASVEVLIMDQAEQFVMQNWDHLLHVFEHLHLQPRAAHGVDMARVRTWALNGWSKYYRQTCICAAYATPEINALFNKHCRNYSGKIQIKNPITKGSICHILVQVPHIYQQFHAKTPLAAADARFDHFTTKILTQFKDSVMSHTLIYIPSYFDYIRLRNYFREHELATGTICEYTKPSRVAQHRDLFYHGQQHFLLYSERFHHFHRIRVKGMRHLIFYQPPTVPHFYAEMCNLLLPANQNPTVGDSNVSVTVLYCKYDVVALNGIIGTERTARMLSGGRNTHMFMTGE